MPERRLRIAGFEVGIWGLRHTPQHKTPQPWSEHKPETLDKNAQNKKTFLNLHKPPQQAKPWPNIMLQNYGVQVEPLTP